jgi:HEAT repeat protein
VPAIGALAGGWKTKPGVVEYLISLLGDPSFHARRAVIAALGAAGSPKAIEPLRQRAAKEADNRLAKEANDTAMKLEQAAQSGGRKEGK